MNVSSRSIMIVLHLLIFVGVVMEKNDNKVFARVPSSLKKKLQAKADKENHTLSSFIRKICTKAVKK